MPTGPPTPCSGNPPDERPDALFVASDTMALGAWQALEELGLRVPEDVALVAFDGLEQSQVARPTLSTVVQPIRALGREATAALIRMIERPVDEPTRCYLGSRLVFRGSCGCAGGEVDLPGPLSAYDPDIESGSGDVGPT